MVSGDVLTPLLEEPVFKKLDEYYQSIGSKINFYELFKKDSARFDKFSLTIPTPGDEGNILIDFSKNRIDDRSRYELVI